MWLLTIGTILGLVIIKHYVNYAAHYKASRQISGPIALPIIGNLWQLMWLSELGIVKRLIDLGNQAESIFRVWLGSKLTVLVTDANDAKIVFNSPDCLNRSEAYTDFAQIVGHGLFVLEDDEWKKRRRTLNPSFNAKQLKSFVPIFNKSTDYAIESFKKRKPDEVFDLYRIIDRCTLDSICQTTIGVDLDLQRGGNIFILDNFGQLLNRLYQIQKYPILKWNPFFKHTKLAKDFKFHLDSFNTFIGRVFQRRSSIITLQNQLNPASVMGDVESDDVNEKKPLIFVENLLRQTEGEMLSKTDIINELKLILVAGFDTTASTISFVLLMLALHPECQQKVYNEVMAIVPTGDIQMSDTAQFDYLERVIKETLRLFPILPLHTRNVSRPITLNGNISIPKGSQIMISGLSIQRSKKYWGITANSFDPDRFLPENYPKAEGLIYLPFGGGPRNCIGMKYAHLAVKVIAAKIIRNLEFHSPLQMKDLRIQLQSMLRLENEHLVSVKVRTEQ